MGSVTMNRLMYLAAGLMVVTQAHSAEFCATNSAELHAHLNSARSNNQDDVIRIEKGTYTGGFVFISQPEEAYALSLEGGYVNFNGNPCGRLQTTIPGNTVLDGDMTDRTLRISGSAGSSVHIRNLAFVNGLAPAGQAGGGLDITGSQMTEVTIENALFSGNVGDNSAAIRVGGVDLVRVSNSIFEANHSAPFTGVAGFSVRGEGLQFINNTVVNNTAAQADFAGVFVSTAETGQAVMVNNLFWGNDGADLAFFGPDAVYLYNNNIEDFTGQVGESVGNLSIAPEFQQNLLNYELVPDSPLVDAGRLPPPPMPSPPFKDSWDLPARDIRNAERVQGPSVDIGAFETASEWIFRDRFEAPVVVPSP